MIKKDPRNIITHISPLFPFESLYKKSGHKSVFPFYHTISDHPGPHLRYLYPVKSIKEFVTDLDKLLKYFSPLSPEILLKEQEDSPLEGFVLSFDDGLSEISRIVAPILKDKGIPAIFFLNNNFIDNKNLFFRYKASLLIDKIRKTGLNKSAMNEAGKMISVKIRSENELIRFILKIQYRGYALIDKLCQIFEVDVESFLREEKPYLDSSGIMKLKKDGFYIGAHSYDHPEFFNMDPLEQEQEIKSSILDIRKRFDLDYSLFAFPFTDYGVKPEVLRSFHFDPVFKPGASFGTAGLKKSTGLPHYQRISMEKYQGDSEKIIKTEFLYYLMKKIIGKN